MITTCGIFIFDQTGKILICRPTGIKTKDGWSIPKGKREKDETSEDAALRELYEETSLTLSTMKKRLVDVGTEKYKSKKKKFQGFVLVIETTIPVEKLKCLTKIDGDRSKVEIDAYEMVDPEEALERIHFTQAKVLKKYLKERKK